jgi:hypothetical protein
MGIIVLPTTLQLPSGYGFPSTDPTAAGSTTAGASATPTSTSPPADIVSISNSWDAGTFTADTGDVYRLADLLQGTAPTGQTVAGYRVALGSGSGSLWLNGAKVVDNTTFTADEFSKLTYMAGDDQSKQSIVAVAQLGTRLSNGTLSHVIDSPAIQITANVTGTRSINALNALVAPSPGVDANMAEVVSETGIFTGLGSGRPTLQTTGNFDAETGDVYRMDTLFNASTPSGQTIAGYRVALGNGEGKLFLNDQDVSTQTTFTAAEFSNLTYQAGTTDAAQQSMVVVAQMGTSLPSGTLTNVVDSPAVEVTATVAATRSINALSALSTPLTGTDAEAADVVAESGIFTGLGTGRPTLQTDGNFTAVSGDTFRMGDLFQASAPSGQTIAGYRVVLQGDSGQLLLNKVAVPAGQTTFTADEFAKLTYTAGADGSQQSLLVVAQTGTRHPDGTLTHVVDSQAMQISANVNGTRSVNAMNALATTLTGPDADVADVVTEAGIFSGAGSGRPTLNTVGNFTAAATDVYRLTDLFQASAPTGHTIAGYRVALGDSDATLLLNGAPVSGKTSFTADEFAKLTYTAGASGTHSLVVVAQTGTRHADGTLTNVADSTAIQITANVTGRRSINAMSALATTPSDADAAVAALVTETSIFAGLGAGRPALQTDGNFTAAEGDVYRLNDLFAASAPTGQTIAGYRVVLQGSSGQLLLNGKSAPADQTSFTADEFAHLTYAAGDVGTQQNLIVAAQLGKLMADHTLTQVVDSPAVQITANVTGSRSINVLNALATPLADAETAVGNVVSEAGIFTGLGTGRPTMQSSLTPEPPISPGALAGLVGAYSQAGAMQTGLDMSQYYPGGIGGFASPGSFTDAGSAALVALLMLGGSAIGAFQTAGNVTQQATAIAAYNLVRGV